MCRPLQGDPIQIKQAILNILLNAIENSHSIGSITLATETKDGNVLIKVEDKGEGIQLAHRDRSFDPFFSTTYIVAWRHTLTRFLKAQSQVIYQLSSRRSLS